jgi:hypothetical protein
MKNYRSYSRSMALTRILLQVSHSKNISQRRLEEALRQSTDHAGEGAKP